MQPFHSVLGIVDVVLCGAHLRTGFPAFFIKRKNVFSHSAAAAAICSFVYAGFVIVILRCVLRCYAFL
jgi:hypothetical protein